MSLICQMKHRLRLKCAWLVQPIVLCSERRRAPREIDYIMHGIFTRQTAPINQAAATLQWRECGTVHAIDAHVNSRRYVTGRASHNISNALQLTSSVIYRPESPILVRRQSRRRPTLLRDVTNVRIVYSTGMGPAGGARHGRRIIVPNRGTRIEPTVRPRGYCRCVGRGKRGRSRASGPISYPTDQPFHISF